MLFPKPTLAATFLLGYSVVDAAVLSAQVLPSSAHLEARSTYTWNATSPSNLFVYYGPTTASKKTTLAAQCNDTNVDTVIMSFVLQLAGPGGYPSIGFSNYCSGMNSAMTAANATGLAWCPGLANNITYCQSLGKKVFVSLGGAHGNTTFANASVAQSGANLLWNTFGGGNLSSPLRPFGSAVVDGFDIDNETGNGTSYDDFAYALRGLVQSYNATKTMYLSAAPACYYPTAGWPINMLTAMDFVWPQFYDSPSCGLGASGNNVSFTNWSSRLATANHPRFMIGALSFQDNGAGGYQSPDNFTKIIAQVRQLNFANFGGITLWDGPDAYLTTNAAGQNYIQVSKNALLA
ncbi:hypothetical protein MBLNU459_g0143t1 [Dothideomycetes sp. NU459]